MPPEKPPIKPILLVVAAALIDKNNNILIAQRPSQKTMAGLWEFPGGKVEKGETPETALCRELKEELNIKVIETDLTPLTFASHNYPDFHLLMPLYTCKNWSGQITALEHDDFLFVAAKHLKNYPMPPADIPLIDLINKIL